jgi:UDP-2,4-diacetamido-2,4,6-trideoxy-beta-L-altropyranose hydrolase
MTPLQIVIRVDASAWIGSGHLARCLTLAAKLRERGAHVTFITRAHAGNPISWITTNGFGYRLLPAVLAPQSGIAGYAAWLECGWERDADDTEAVLMQLGGGDWLIVDHYGIHANWETRMRKHVRRIMVIDDLAVNSHDCDLLLDQNLFTDLMTRYSGLVSQECITLLGPKYALLRPDFAKYRQRISRRIASPYRILVFFGGVDATDETGKFLSAWSIHGGSAFTADVVVGVSNPRAALLSEQADRSEGIRMYGQVNNMADLMAQADYAFGASGATNWERFCMGLNSSITSVADNQLALAHHLDVLGLIDYLGDWHRTSEATYERALTGLSLGSDRLARRRKQIMHWVDGLGADRVVQRITEGLEAVDEIESFN